MVLHLRMLHRPLNLQRSLHSWFILKTAYYIIYHQVWTTDLFCVRDVNVLGKAIRLAATGRLNGTHGALVRCHVICEIRAWLCSDICSWQGGHADNHPAPKIKRSLRPSSNTVPSRIKQGGIPYWNAWRLERRKFRCFILPCREMVSTVCK